MDSMTIQHYGEQRLTVRAGEVEQESGVGSTRLVSHTVHRLDG